MRTKTPFRILMAALATAVVLVGCQPGENEKEEPAPTSQMDHPNKRQFDSMTVNASVEMLQVKKDGSVVRVSSGTMATVIDAVMNKYRMEVKSSDPDVNQLIIFDGERVWNAVAREKAVYGGDPEWKDYMVWDQVRPNANADFSKAPLRGLDTTVMKTPEGRFWLYKGVIVQFEKKNGDTVVRTALQDLKENQPVPERTFDLPAGYAKINYP